MTFGLDGLGSHGSIEEELETSLPVVVGGEGVIGRRITVFSGGLSTDERVMAEGIVGYNH